MRIVSIVDVRILVDNTFVDNNAVDISDEGLDIRNYLHLLMLHVQNVTDLLSIRHVRYVVLGWHLRMSTKWSTLTFVRRVRCEHM